MTYDVGRPSQSADVGAFCTRDSLGHMYTFEPGEFSGSSAVAEGGWDEERVLMGITVEGIDPSDTEAVVEAIRRQHAESLAALGRS